MGLWLTSLPGPCWGSGLSGNEGYTPQQLWSLETISLFIQVTSALLSILTSGLQVEGPPHPQIMSLPLLACRGPGLQARPLRPTELQPLVLSLDLRAFRGKACLLPTSSEPRAAARSLLKVLFLEKQGIPPKPGPVLFLFHLVLCQVLNTVGQAVDEGNLLCITSPPIPYSPPPNPPPRAPRSPGQTLTTLG